MLLPLGFLMPIQDSWISFIFAFSSTCRSFDHKGGFLNELPRARTAIRSDRPPAPPTPDEMQQLFSVAEKYEYWLASPDENAAIGISLR